MEDAVQRNDGFKMISEYIFHKVERFWLRDFVAVEFGGKCEDGFPLFAPLNHRVLKGHADGSGRDFCHNVPPCRRKRFLSDCERDHGCILRFRFNGSIGCHHLFRHWSVLLFGERLFGLAAAELYESDFQRDSGNRRKTEIFERLQSGIDALQRRKRGQSPADAFVEIPPRAREELPKKHFESDAVLLERHTDHERPLAVMRFDRVPKLFHIFISTLPDAQAHVLLRDLPDGRTLIKERHGIAHAPAHMARNGAQRSAIRRNALFIGNVLERTHDVLLAYFAERKTLAARLDRIRHLVEFSCGKNEERVWRGFFEGFEERIERFFRHHVHFVDDVHLGRSDDRCELYLLLELPNVIDLAIRGGINLDEIDQGSLIGALDDLLLDVFVLHIPDEEDFRKNPRDRGFPRSAGTEEEIRVHQLIALHGMLQGGHDVFLPNDIRKALGAILEVKAHRD